MKKYKFLPVLLLLSMILSLVSAWALAVEYPTTASERICMVDAASGSPVYTKNQDVAAPPASLTKIMTVLLGVEAVERGDVTLDENVTASGNISFDLIADGSSAGITAGETMSYKDYLYCAMVSSANEACNVIAERVSGSVAAFVESMNARAAELGCTNTHFANTHGLPNTDHYTTAHDMMLIAKEAVTHSLFLTICNTRSYTVPATNSSQERTLQNTNGLINPDSEIYPDYYYEYAVGVKTGHTDAAGYCLISTAAKNGANFLLVVMGGKAQDTRTRVDYSNFSDSINLYNWAFENFSYRDVLKSTALIADVPVNMGQGTESVTVHPETSIRVLLPNDDTLESFQQDILIYSERDGVELTAPIEAGTVLGEISILRDGEVYGSTKLVASSNVDVSYGDKIKAGLLSTLSNPIVITVMALLLALIILYVVLMHRYNKAHRGAQRPPERRAEPSGAGRSGRSAKVQPRHEKKPVRRNSADNAEEFFGDIEPGARDDEFGFYSDGSKTGGETQSQAEKDYFDEFFGKK